MTEWRKGKNRNMICVCATNPLRVFVGILRFLDAMRVMHIFGLRLCRHTHTGAVARKHKPFPHIGSGYKIRSRGAGTFWRRRAQIVVHASCEILKEQKLKNQIRTILLSILLGIRLLLLCSAAAPALVLTIAFHGNRVHKHNCSHHLFSVLFCSVFGFHCFYIVVPCDANALSPFDDWHFVQTARDVARTSVVNSNSARYKSCLSCAIRSAMESDAYPLCAECMKSFTMRV